MTKSMKEELRKAGRKSEREVEIDRNEETKRVASKSR